MNVTNTTRAFVPQRVHPPKAFQPAADPELEQVETFVKSQERGGAGAVVGANVGLVIGAILGGPAVAFIGLVIGGIAGAVSRD